MTTLPTVGVCGFGRCGSTMAMAVLAAGGIPTADGANPHSHEHPDVGGLAQLPPAALAGRAVKLLDMVLYPDVTQLPEPGAWRLVWLDRDPRQQALSQRKFLRGMGIPLPARAVAEMEASYRRDRPRALTALARLGPVHVDTYERALADPAGFVADLAGFLGPDLALDRAAARAVHQRGPRCLPGLDFELAGMTR